ncbi:hypothetical protein C8R46DRAFT_1221955 [Mycena filopes]|nr:hypothetical protein C8R46DRAFT_1221955 [Mycena filopes]
MRSLGHELLLRLLVVHARLVFLMRCFELAEGRLDLAIDVIKKCRVISNVSGQTEIRMHTCAPDGIGLVGPLVVLTPWRSMLLDDDGGPRPAFLYRTVRLPSLSGYNDPVPVDSFLHPVVAGITTPPAMDRVFRIREHAYFVWSPNSSRVPHFPGAHARDRRIGSNYIPPLPERRVDGHLGPKDPTRNPQPYQENEPWLAFVRRQDPYDLIDIDIAYVKVYDVWKTHVLDGPYGYLCPRFIQFLLDAHRDQDKEIARLSSRPIRSGIRSWANWAKYVPFDEDFKNLGVITRFDDAVDLVTKIQRLLLEKRAWCAMVDSYPYADQQWTSQDRLIQQLAKKPVVLADDQFIGVWINGQAAPLDVLWFLTTARIPCFVLQEVTGSPIPPQMRKSPVAGTEIEGDVQRALYDKKAQMPP